METLCRRRSREALTPGPSPGSPLPIPGRGEKSKNRFLLLVSPLPAGEWGELGEGRG
jgi:hypothetical protein